MRKWGLVLIVIVGILIVLAIFVSFYYVKFSPNRSLSISFTPAPAKEITIVALGDSLTQAANPSHDLIGNHPEYSYACGAEIKSLDQYFKLDGYEVNCHNFSVSGATSSDVLNLQIKKAQEQNPDLIVMTIGGNDAMQGLASSDLKNNLSKTIASFPSSKILIGNIPNLEEFRKNNYPACQTPLSQYWELESLTAVYILSYNLAIESVENQNVKIIDLFNNLGMSDVSNYDCLHFSILGQEKAAQLFFSQF